MRAMPQFEWGSRAECFSEPFLYRGVKILTLFPWLQFRERQARGNKISPLRQTTALLQVDFFRCALGFVIFSKDQRQMVGFVPSFADFIAITKNFAGSAFGQQRNVF
jgi:hypothetical protein